MSYFLIFIIINGIHAKKTYQGDDIKHITANNTEQKYSHGKNYKTKMKHLLFSYLTKKY